MPRVAEVEKAVDEHERGHDAIPSGAARKLTQVASGGYFAVMKRVGAMRTRAYASGRPGAIEEFKNFSWSCHCEESLFIISTNLPNR